MYQSHSFCFTQKKSLTSTAIKTDDARLPLSSFRIGFMARYIEAKLSHTRAKASDKIRIEEFGPNSAWSEVFPPIVVSGISYSQRVLIQLKLNDFYRYDR